MNSITQQPTSPEMVKGCVDIPFSVVNLGPKDTKNATTVFMPVSGPKVNTVIDIALIFKLILSGSSPTDVLSTIETFKGDMVTGAFASSISMVGPIANHHNESLGLESNVLSFSQVEL